ncbi:hypothetical protein PanWU01x14_262220 [Parasponia andersonii]|uniref:Uncharacterized protein n=1 Tax=Parasponia andersonii TaxID=3476 RepID=A0A2P5B8F3_PARAD|nr:hypothetical protein PanWU01x14_262220 [Parasponia andersonii]
MINQNVIDCNTAQYNITMQQYTMINTSNMDTNNHLQQHVLPETAFENLDLSYDISVDQTRLCNSPMNLQQFRYSSESRTRNSAARFESSHDPSDKQMESSVDAMQISVMNDIANMHVDFMEPITAHKEQQGNEKDSNKQDRGQSSLLSDCSDQFDDDDD